MPSGGANGGPQYNPANVSATGGNGQAATNRQAAMYIPGMKSLGSTGESTMAQQSGAAMYREANNTPSQSSPVPLTAETMFPEQPITHGAPIGAGPMEIAGLPKPPTGDPDMDALRAYYPVIQFWASQPGSSQGTKDYAAYLGTIL